MRFALLVLLLAATAVAGTGEERRVGAVPADLRRTFDLATFYEKHVDLHGFPIVGSAKVTGYALLEAAYVIESMLAGRRDILATLAKGRVRCCVMAHDEVTTDVPEHSDLKPGRFWDRRARGLGASRQRPCVSCAEENLLGFPGDPYYSENILVHEFAHAIDLMGLRVLDDTFEKRLTGAYEAAMKAGLWKGLYAAENKEEYWAEGVQSWFGTNRPPDSLHNHVDTREELNAYDARLAQLIGEAFGDNPWRYVHPAKRTTSPHLDGFDRAKAPTFAWPDGLETWYRQYEKDRDAGKGRPDLKAYPASEARSAKSRGTSKATTILFINRTTADLAIFWITFDGARKPYGRVKAGRSNELPTYVGHKWVLVDEGGEDVAMFEATALPGRAVVEPLR